MRRYRINPQAAKFYASEFLGIFIKSLVIAGILTGLLAVLRAC